MVYRKIEQVMELLKKEMKRAKQKGMANIRINFEHNEIIKCDFQNNRLKDVGNKEKRSLLVEVISDGRKGIGMGNNLQKIEELINDAVTFSKYGKRVHFTQFPPANRIPDVKTYSEKTDNITRDDLIESCRTFVDNLKEFDPDLYVVANGSKSRSERIIMTSGNVCEVIHDTKWKIGGYVQRIKPDDMLFAGYWREWKDATELYEVNSICDHIKDELQRGEKTGEPVRGISSAILPPHILKQLLFSFILGVNGSNVAKKSSPLQNRIGEQIFDDCFTIIDDPLSDYSIGSCKISDEGIPAQRITIIENGVLKNFLCDLETSCLLETEATGHNHCMPHNPVVFPGTGSLSELMKDMGTGIYINNLLGFERGNIINGDFNCNLGVGYQVINGKIAHRIKNVMVSGNIYSLFRDNVILSSEVEPVLQMPYAVIKGLNVI